MNAILIFTAYGPPSAVNTFFFILTFLVYLITILANLFLALVIIMEPSLQKPMYVFMLHLAINGVIGSTSVCPKIMDLLISSTKESSYEGCLGQVFFINFYASSAYAILTAMAYDRYVSICKPLQYHTIMTSGKVKQLVFVIYFFPITALSTQVYLTSKLPLCKNNINKLFCDNLAIVNLSCVKSNLGNIFGIFIIIFLVVLPLILVVISYIKILAVCLKTSKDAQKKALSTCTPHLITFVNFSIASLFSVIYNRFNDYIPSHVNFFMSLHFILLPPLLHPLIYGIRTLEIRKCIAKILRKRVFTDSLPIVLVNSRS
uniref:Olfactory receptor n=1 Tax=Scleropages formosus TaxID=113540 RepID=A0A8C9R3F0_SCLFO